MPVVAHITHFRRVLLKFLIKADKTSLIGFIVVEWNQSDGVVSVFVCLFVIEHQYPYLVKQMPTASTPDIFSSRKNSSQTSSL